MRWLFTADLQAEWQNLPTCRRVWKQMVREAVNSRLEGICIAGDLKRQYNPVDIRVIKFWQWAIESAVSHNLNVKILLGNHDRIGQYSDDKNWLSVLKRAGAQVYDEPQIVRVTDGWLAMLPYRTSVEQLRKDASYLSRESWQVKKETVLVFHADINGAKYNKTGTKSEGRLRANELHPSQYRACIGGHIHLPQRIGKNIYYTGSPFCTDWGEANQRKSFYIIRDSVVERVSSVIPGWYDERWPDFPDSRRVSDWRKAKIRIHVPCAIGVNYGKVLEDARTAAEQRYRGAEVLVVAEFKDEVQKEAKIKLTDPDSVKIREYLKKNTPEDVDMARAAVYLQSRLDKVPGAQRATHGIKVIRTWAENFLSFKEAKMRFEPGITLVQGTNKDRQNCSNGSGKTSLLQIAPVALFGTTFKGQKHDKWSKRSTEDTAAAGVVFRDGHGRKVMITRTRRPSGLHLSINGADHSSGLRNDARDATQGQVEQTVGFSWKTFANAAYIDQEVTRAFLTGTRKEQTQVLSQFQNLERFTEAQVAVRKDKVANKRAKEEVAIEISLLMGSEEELEQSIQDLSKQQKKDEKQLRITCNKTELAVDVAEREQKKVAKKIGAEVKPLESLLRRIGTLVTEANQQLGKIEARMQQHNSLLSDTEELCDDRLKPQCPTCHQTVDQVLLGKLRKHWRDKLTEERKHQKKILAARAHAMLKEVEAESGITVLTRQVNAANDLVNEKKQAYRFARQQLTAFQQSEVDEASIISTKKKRLAGVQSKLLMHRKALKKLVRDARLYEFADEAFGRDGIPAFLNALLVRPLNHAAEYYAELFAQKAIQLRFAVVDGEFEVRVVNAMGGEQLEDQSAGERALAGLIASFALREVAPKCNVLILDEPGEGLDPQAARAFAQSLKTLQSKFDCIYVTTHNAAIMGELAGEHQLMVVKKSGTSRIVS